MITALFTVQIFAESAVCYIGSKDNSYDSIEDAIKTGGDIYLLKDAVLSTDAHFYSKKVKLYGNGRTVKLERPWLIDLNCDIALYDVTFDLNQNYITVTGDKAVVTLGKGATLKNGLANNGGALIMYRGSKVIMEDGSLITDCKANYGGGGIHTHEGTLEMKGGTIKNCIGGGINASADGKLYISGNATVTGNKKQDGSVMNIRVRKAFTIKGNLTGKIGVTVDAEVGEEFAKTEGAVSGLTNITSDADSSLVGSAKDGAVVLKNKAEAIGNTEGATTEKEAETGDAVCYAGPNEEIGEKFSSVDDAIASKLGDVHLLSDATLSTEKKFYSTNLSIYGHGHTLKLENRWDIDLSSDIKLYDINVDLNKKSISLTGATLTLGKGTTLKNGLANNGGAVVLYTANGKTAMLNIESGSKITACTANYGGGGVHANTGVINMTGGTVENCTGGGIMVPETAKITISGDAEIKNNKNKDGEPYNLVAKFPEVVTFKGTLSKKIYVTNEFSENAKIANAENAAGAENIILDKSEAYIGKADGDKIIWILNPSSDAALMQKFLPKEGWTISVNSENGESGKKIIDGNKNTYWHSRYKAENGVITDKDNLPFTIDITFPEETVISGIEILPRQDSNKSGVPTRVKYYAKENGEWVMIDDVSYPQAQTVKHYDFIRNIKVKAVRIEIVEAVAGYGTLAEADFFAENKELETVGVTELVEIMEKSKLYKLDKSEASVIYDGDWWNNHVIEHVIDGSDANFWQAGKSGKPSYEFTVDMGKTVTMSAVSYYPRVTADEDGYWADYSILSSIDGEDFIIEADHVKIAPEERTFTHHYTEFEAPIEARYVKFIIYKGDGNLAACGEVDFYEDYATRAARLKTESEEYKLVIGKNEITHKNGTATLDVAPFIDNGTTMIPLRGLLELMGAEIGWNGENQTVTVKKGETEIELRIMYKNVSVTNAKYGKLRYTLLTPPIIKDSRTFVPIRFISEHLGYNVSWDGATQTVTISK